MNALKIENVSHSFGDKKVLHDIDLEVECGQIVGLVGPSGCGKSTLLKAILGTHLPKEGEIFAGNKKVIAPSSNVGIVYQHYSLYPFLTAKENVAFGLMLRETSLPYRLFNPFGWNKLRKIHFNKAQELLEKVNLTNAINLYPNEMSGGMRQRVAIAQALIMKPAILLLDEPFGALDEATREELQLMLLHLYQENLEAKKQGRLPPTTILIVTHELNEAIYVSDRVIGLSQYHADGHLGSTIVYDKPSPIFHPNDAKEFSIFEKQKEELRKAVFDTKSRLNREEYVTFWKERQIDQKNS